MCDEWILIEVSHLSVLMELSQEGAMETPAKAQPLRTVRTHHIYTFALSLICIALVVSVIEYLMIEL